MQLKDDLRMKCDTRKALAGQICLVKHRESVFTLSFTLLACRGADLICNAEDVYKARLNRLANLVRMAPHGSDARVVLFTGHLYYRSSSGTLPCDVQSVA
jgi:hypothetical protein